MTADYEKLKRKYLNAVKHGAFSSVAILPGEDPDEYHALVEAFCNEWNPEGATEIDAIYTLTNCVWRKRRIRKFIAERVELRSLDPDHPAFDPDLALGIINEALQMGPKYLEKIIEENPALQIYLAKKYPEHLRDLVEPAKLVKEFENHIKEQLKRRASEAREVRELRRADVVGEDLFKQELAMEERLDAMIDRAIKRLMQAKAMKQMLASPSLNGQAQQPKRISSSNGAQAQPSTQED